MQAEAISEKIRRAQQVSQINGWTIFGFAALCALVAFILKDIYGFLVGFAVSFSGLMELRGHFTLKQRMRSAINWLVFSQLYLMVVLWLYCLNNIFRFDHSDLWARFSPDFKNLIIAINPDIYLVEEMLRLSYYVVYVSVIVAVLLYQGGLCLYYLTRKKYLVAASD